MYPEIRGFSPLPDGKLFIEFSSGETGIFDMIPYMKSAFFSALKNSAYFNSAHLELGVITWPMGQDISPTTMKMEMVLAAKPEHVILRTSNYHSIYQ